MKTNIKSILNDPLLTLSGICPEKDIPEPRCLYISMLIELYQLTAINTLPKKLEELRKLISKMEKYRNVGDFLCNHKNQQKELAAYLIIAIDRLAKAAKNNEDGWQAMNILDQIYECQGYLPQPSRSYQASRGAKAKDTKRSKSGEFSNFEKRQEIKKIWASGKYKSRDICAEQECAGLNMSFSTARKALRNTPNPP